LRCRRTFVNVPHRRTRLAGCAGSATAIALIYPELKGKLNGHAVRVPLLNASLTDCVFSVNRDTTAEEVNKLLQDASNEGPLVVRPSTRPHNIHSDARPLPH
jgi:glyceraldehyde 3-phosphate dehydrogenase